MIGITDLINGHRHYGLWHGTKATIKDSLKPGGEILGKAKEVISQIWEGISEKQKISIEHIHPEDVLNYFSNSTYANQNTVALGNTIRYLKGGFDYSSIAFGFDEFTARGYAKEGSELANAINSLLESCRESEPNLFNSEKIQNAAKKATEITNELTSGPGKVIKLIKLPENGYFWAPGKPNIPVKTLTREPFREKLIYTELFFSGEIPIDHLEIYTLRIT